LLAKVVEIEDPATGTVRLRRRVEGADEMAPDTPRTPTVRGGEKDRCRSPAPAGTGRPRAATAANTPARRAAGPPRPPPRPPGARLGRRPPPPRPAGRGRRRGPPGPRRRYPPRRPAWSAVNRGSARSGSARTTPTTS